MLVVILAALALAGAPAGTQVTCVAQPGPWAGNRGFTWFAPPPRIELSAQVCGGLLLLEANETDRSRILAANVGVDGPTLMGLAALVTLHESSHAAGLYNETDAECRAMSLVAELLARYRDPVGMKAAEWYDSKLPAAYHAHGC